MKTWSLLLGIGLGILWIVGLGTTDSAPWLTWLDAIGAVSAFIIAGTVPNYGVRRTRASGPFGLAIGLFALWIIGMATNGAPWQNWWNFAFACAFVLVGLYAARGEVVTTPESTEIGGMHEEGRDRYKRSA